MRTFGNAAIEIGSGALWGDVESPLPIWLMETMNHSSGSSA